VKIIIVGAGMAAYFVVQRLRKLDKTVDITVVCGGSGDQYYKPNLSKTLRKMLEPESLVTATASDWAQRYNVTLIENSWVERLDPNRKTLLVNRQILAYDKLVLAVGAIPSLFDDVEGIFHLNSLQSYFDFRQRLARHQEVLVLGGGLIGCEISSDLANAGYQPALMCAGAGPLEHMLPAQGSLYLQQYMEQMGVIFKTHSRVLNITQDENNNSVVTFENGEQLVAPLVLNCTGLQANTAIAKAAGLVVNKGIVTDEYLQTSEVDIFAIGDCAEIKGELYQYVPPIMQSARALAATLLGNATAFNIGQFPVTIEIHGMPVRIQGFTRAQEWEFDVYTGGAIAVGKSTMGEVLSRVIIGDPLVAQPKAAAAALSEA